MTPQELAESQLFIANLQVWVTGLAIFLGPLAGVIFTLWFQKRKEKRDAKQNLFIELMAERKSIKITPNTARVLNTIDVVFGDNEQVKSLWHKYYSLLSVPPSQERDHTWLELLTAMSKDLHYPKLSQIDLDKFYVPQGHVDDLEFQQRVSENWLRVLENTEKFLIEPRTPPAK